MNSRLIAPATALRIAIGLMATLAGLDKFFNLLANWEAYVAANLVLGGHLDIAVRDVVLSVSAFMLARLEEVRAGNSVHVTPGASRRTVTA